MMSLKKETKANDNPAIQLRTKKCTYYEASLMNLRSK